MLAVISGQVFTNTFMQLDNTHFKQCSFRQCRLIFRAEGNVAFTDCTFDHCHWILDGPAETTLLYLSALYRQLGPEGRELVEAVFQSIRDGSVANGREIVIRSPALAR